MKFSPTSLDPARQGSSANHPEFADESLPVLASPESQERTAAATDFPDSEPAARRIVQRTTGQKHGPITRLISPGDLGQTLKPFVFLDLFDSGTVAPKGFGTHPHSGIATLTWLMRGSVQYTDSSGREGMLLAGGMEWMHAGGGAWHAGTPGKGQPMRAFQLWLALPPALESTPAVSVYVAADSVPREGPARVLLGSYGAANSSIKAPASITYLAVVLKAGERWRFEPPADHKTAWLAVASGILQAPERLPAGTMAIFEESSAAIVCVAETDVEFVVASAVKHPHELVLGRYSVHTSVGALQAGEERIRQLDTSANSA
jgi:redox-sensitive bicupin YhaK (pirin superfamily)